MQKTKKIYLYLTQYSKNELNRLHNQHHLSLSTISNIIINNIYCFCSQNPNITSYYRIPTPTKLCIKPRLEKVTKIVQPYILRNCIEYYIMQSNLNEKDQDKEFKQAIGHINHEIKNTYEARWQYNKQLRDTTRIVKHNRSYFKKILGAD